MLLLMRFAYKYRLYPNQAQVHFLENQLHSLERREASSTSGRTSHHDEEVHS
ncbi:MAG: hypothetical protein DMG39_14220 [Acidobacteria bacterium]|nr:MAG: hypothetical protein DMG39_14220 [Acidobacteriota bacterium]